MTWTVLYSAIIFYLITAISGAPNRSQRPECPNNQLRVYVNVTESDREEYYINRTEAITLLDCTQKCYNDPHCFSLKYHEVDPLGCILTGFTPESCLKIISVPADKIKYDANTIITIDCIKCKLIKQPNGNISFTDDVDDDNDDDNNNDKPLQSLPVLQNTIVSNSEINVCEPSPMRCQKDIWFIAEEQINGASSDFFEKTVTANSVGECAEKCFDDCCKIAGYSEIEKKCQLTKENKSEDVDSCDMKPFSSYVNQYNGSNWIKITCVTCGLSSIKNDQHMLTTSAGDFADTEKSIRLKEKSKSGNVEKVSESAEVSQSNNSKEPIIPSALNTFDSLPDKLQSRLDSEFMNRACVVTFEVNLEADMANFKAQDSVKANRADHCAYLCYRDACSAAIFTPATASGNKGTCERQFDITEKCNSTLQRDYYYKTTKPIYLQCFRCLPQKPITKSSLESITLQPETSLITSKKPSSEMTAVNHQTEANEELIKTTLVPDVELNTVKTESEEIEKNVATTAFDVTNGNMEISAGVKKTEDEADTSSIETTQTTPMIGSSISDAAFENKVVETEPGTEMLESMSPNSLSVEHETEPTQEPVSTDETGSKIQAREFIHQSTTESEELNSLDRSTTENVNKREQSSTIMPSSTNAGITEFGENTEIIDKRSTMEAKSSVEQNAHTEGHINTIHTNEITTASNTERRNEAVSSSNLSVASNNSTLTPPKQKKKNQLSSKSGAFYTYLQGCIVTFQADSYNKRPAESFADFQASTIAQTAEVCAGRCYQDGCTGARYDPFSKECALGYSGKQICNNGPQHFFYEANETIWIHCTTCRSHKPGDEGINIVVHLPETKETQKVESTISNEIPETNLRIASDKSAPEVEKSTEHIADADKTLTSSPPPPLSSSLSSSSSAIEETVKVSPITEEVTITSTGEKKTEISEQELSSVASPTSVITEKVDESASTKETSITVEPFQTTPFGQDCTLSFQVRPIDAHSKEPTITTSTVKDCARRCYMDGCSGAKFNPINGECLLIFEDHHQCDENEQQHHSLEATEPIWIYCISCKKEFAESTLGLAEETTTLPVTVEKLKEEDHSAAADKSSSTLESPEIEGKLLTSVSQDLESKGKIASQFPTDTDVVPESSVSIGTAPPAAEGEETSSSPTSQLSMASEIETISTTSGITEKSEGTSGNDELDTTIQPDLISLTLQTPLNVPTDNSEVSNIDGGVSRSSSTSSTTEESTQTSTIESGKRKDEKEGTDVEFQEEFEPTTISSDITLMPASNEITDDIVEAVADIVANISKNILEPEIKTTDMSEESNTESHEIASSLASETPSITEETESTFEEVGTSNVATVEAVSEITSIENEISTSMSTVENTKETSEIVEKVSDETLSSESIPNAITEQPFVHEYVDDIIKKIAQSKDILVTGIKPLVADAAVEEEVIKKLIEKDEGITDKNIANTLANGDEDMTTEPPVQAVSDLISFLSRNMKTEEVIGRTENENDAFVVNEMSVTKKADDETMTGIAISQLQESFTKNSLQNLAKIKPFEEATTECLGRIEFEIVEVDFSQLNITNEIIIESPAACATKCYKMANCFLAAYKPSQNDESTGAVCMLTSNPAVCTTEEKFIPQHKSDLSPFAISCLKCTKCDYTISAVTELTRIHKAETVLPALSVEQCSEICWKHNCTAAQYDHKSNLCSLTSVNGQKNCTQEMPITVNGDEPVLLECVRCFA
ncbi:unnamed protein product [Cercopithifilaria johnstoni]|uniref:Apple domain-containing protein n=1 Tax=Cercopithifilaria johnstoni TaxID=2874296 RepID=A0A8J2M7Z6_9BILA|nr:unnamed protein product [Cercopithifilaria johnstoni]